MKIQLVLFFIALTTFLSCKRTITDTLQISQKNVILNSKGDSILITTKNTWFGFNGIYLNGAMLNIDVWTDPCKINYKDSVLQISSNSCDSLFIRMNKNQTSIIRELSIGIWRGDYNDGILISQNPMK
ncbi:MAG: hypothetical protein KGL19_10495 [Bacteroidota bacterium]|nr:hypothetical protein [Bacteroidota bacterium]